MPPTLLEELKAVADKRIDPLLKRREVLQKELDEIDAELAAAQKAIAALEGKSEAPAAKKPTTRKSNKKKASVEEVLKVMEAELKRLGGKIGVADHMDAVKDKLREAGYGLTGLKQRFEKLLKEDDRFVCKGKSVSLSAKGS